MPPGSGSAGLAIAERRVVTSPDLFADPRIELPDELRAKADDFPYPAVLAVPLIARDRVIGALTVGQFRDVTFDDEQQRLAQLFAGQAALAFENAGLFERAGMRARKLTTLSVLTQHIASASDSEAVSDAVGEAALRLLGAKLALVWIDNAGGLRLDAVACEDPELSARVRAVIELPRGAPSVTGAAFQSRSPAYTTDARADARWRRSDLLRAADFPAWAAIPMLLADGPIGVLTTAFEARGAFSDEDRELMRLLADHAAIAIERRRSAARMERARSAAEAATRAKSEFLAVMSHRDPTRPGSAWRASSGARRRCARCPSCC